MLLFLFIILLVAPGDAIAYTPPGIVPPRFSGGALYRNLLDDHLVSGRLNREYVNVTASVFHQLVNHSNPEGSTFNQRFWVDYSAWDGGEEAMLYIPGEAPGRSSPDGYAGVYGHRRHMLLFSLENRYYGESLPAPLTNTADITNYLGVDIAIDDLRFFQLYVEKLVGKKLRWLVVGGSYAGALSVWFKVKYPTAALAVWSSSGVVEPRLNFYAYDGHVRAEIPPDCANAVVAVQLLFSTLWENKTSRIDFMDRFHIPHQVDKAGVSFMLADAVAGAVQYGKKWQMCDMLVPQNKTDPLGQFFNMIVHMYGPEFTSGCSYSTKCLSNASMSDQWGPAGYAWVLQTCKELGYFQVAYYKSLRLEDVNTDYFVNQCRSVFGNSIFPDVFKFNKKWGGKRPKAGNVVALQGSDDPWRELGVTKTLRTNYQAFIAECEGCGHCGDLAFPSPRDPPSLREQREQLTRYLDIWMSSEATSFLLSLDVNITDTVKENKETLLKAIQSDLHDFFDHTVNLHSLFLDKVNHRAAAIVDVFVNSMNRMEINSALVNLRKDSSWLLSTHQRLDLWGIKKKVAILYFEEQKLSISLDDRRIPENVDILPSTLTLLFFVAALLAFTAHMQFRRGKNDSKPLVG